MTRTFKKALTGGGAKAAEFVVSHTLENYVILRGTTWSRRIHGPNNSVVNVFSLRAE
jgi:hypothetical protein